MKTALSLYALAVVVLFGGWWGTYLNQSLLRQKNVEAATPAKIGRWMGWLRVTLALLAIGANVEAIRLLRNSWSSVPGLACWIGSLLLLVVSCFREPRAKEYAHNGDAGQRSAAALLNPQTFEFVAVVLVLVLGLTMRLWRLGDLAPGMHGDEGEAGVEALNILHGNFVSPFTPGWSNQPNFYYWSIALGMRLFGSGLFGLRSFSVIMGMVTLVFVYLIAREMLGTRAAILAGFFMAFQSAGLIFSRQEFSNGTSSAFMAVALYCVLRGLRTRLYLDFVCAGIAAGLGLYFFAGGRLVCLLVVSVLAYLAVGHRGFLRHYWSQAGALMLAMYAVGSPFLFYYVVDHRVPFNSYPNDRFIWADIARLTEKYQSHNWVTIFWDQLIDTLSVMTSRPDASALGSLDYPIARPIEAALLVVGLAWAAWRWRDTRFAIISVWFWSSIIAGGVLTFDPPELSRIVGILPVLPLAMASVLEHTIVLVARVARIIGGRVHWVKVGQWASTAIAALAVSFSGIQNWQMYINHYLNTHQNAEATGQAAYVQRKGAGVRFYDLGAHMVYWTHGDNRFINAKDDGIDAANMSNYLPIIDNGEQGDKDAAFLVWTVMRDYLAVLRVYYPEGAEEVVPLGDATNPKPPLIGFTLTRQQIEAHRVLTARYTDSAGATTQRLESSLGTDPVKPLPIGLTFPAVASWDGAVVAPSYDVYQFKVEAPASTRLTIDGSDVLTPNAPGDYLAPITVVFARGVHTLHLSTSLADASSRVNIQWAEHGSQLEPVARRYLWDNHVAGAWLGEVDSADSGDPVAKMITSGQPPSASPTAITRRVDGFLGFRNAGEAFGARGPISAHWSAALIVLQAGRYKFRLNSNGDSVLFVDKKPVVQNVHHVTNAISQDGTVDLQPGDHAVEIGYSWQSGLGFLECWWTPPGQAEVLLSTPTVRLPEPGIWPPDGIILPVAKQTAELGSSTALPLTAPTEIINLPDMGAPRGLSIDVAGLLYVGDDEHGRILVVDHQGRVQRSWGSFGKGPGQFSAVSAVRIGPDGKLYVLDDAVPRIQRFTLDGKLDGVIDGAGRWCKPAGFTVATSGRVLVANTCASKVELLGSDGKLQLNVWDDAPPDQRFEQPTDVVSRSDGAIFVADLRQRLVQLAADGSFRAIWPLPIGTARGAAKLAIGGDVVYVTDPDRSTVTALIPKIGHKIPLAGAGTRPGELKQPTGIAVGSDGNVYILDAGNHRIQVFHPVVASGL